MNKTTKKIFVGISGGVDSSVSAALLKEQGYDVTGVFIKVWQPPFMECSIKDDRRDAMRVCAQLEIPFLECDAEDAYKTQVIDYMMNEYRIGRTPNPDVMCNKYVKFGIFYEWAMQRGAHYVATGHYAQSKNGKLLRGKDASKDQSYFLWAIGPDKVKKTLFPIGEMEKSEVRAIAHEHKLFTAEKKDSQGLCFLGKLDVKEFLKKFIESKKGNVLNSNNDVIGEHDGAFFFTMGERHGFRITKKSPDDQAFYVIAKDVIENTITVAPKAQNNDGDMYMKREISVVLENVVTYNSEKMVCTDSNIKAVYRYHGHEVVVQNIEMHEGRIILKLEKCPPDIALGQSIVLYSDNEVIAGGTVSAVV